MRLSKFIFGFCITVFVVILAPIKAKAQGIRFTGLEENIDERTSLDFFNDRAVSFKDELEISFQASMLPKSNFGYILRIKDSRNTGRIWNLFYNGRARNSLLQLNEEGRYSLIKAYLPEDELKPMHPTDISLRFDLSKDSVYLNVSGLVFKAKAGGLPKETKPIIEFGKSDHIIDVPSFEIRNLRIRGAHKEYDFPLNESDGEDVHDSHGKAIGHVRNPTWLIRESIEWKFRHSLQEEDIAGVSYINDRKQVLCFTADSTISYGIIGEKTTRRKTADRCSVKLRLGMSCYADDKLYSYEPFTGRLDNDQYSVASLDIDSGTWTPVSKGQLPTVLHHHCSFLNPFSGEITVFGGFGEELYNGRFYALKADGHWEEVWAGMHDTLYPRYFVSSGISPDGRYLYIFGGMGNESGEQVVGRRYFYDLHKIDMETGACTKLWEIDWDGADMAPVRNLVVCQDSFYTLCYPEYVGNSQLTLYKFSLLDGTYESFGNSIPITSNRIQTNANLYYDEELSKMIVTVQEFSNDIKSKISIYTLSFPPHPISFISDGKNTRKWVYAGVPFLLLIIGGCLLYRYLRKRRIKVDKAIVREKKNNPEKRVFKSTVRPNAIYLFGEFAVFDRNGNDISLTFSGQLRTILLLIVQYSVKGGLSSQKLSNILWPDKEEDKVKNSRGVAINHLRKALSELDGITLVFTEGNYKLILDQEYFCDYLYFLNEISKSGPDRMSLLNIASRGKFLQYVNDPLFDKLKDDTESKLITFLNNELENSVSNQKFHEAIEIADLIFSIDPLDENALKVSVRSLCKMHLKAEALEKYAQFATEYRKINDTNYIPFKDLL